MSESIKDKIKKLLALGSKNPNEFEAMRAMAKARELMAKFNVTPDDKPDRTHVPHVNIVFWTGRYAPKEAYYIAGLADEFRCSVVSKWNNDKYRQEFSVFGSQYDIEIAIDAMKLVYKTFCATWRTYFKTIPARKRTKRATLRVDYCYGFCYGFMKHMTKDAEGKGIVLVTPDYVKDAARAHIGLPPKGAVTTTSGTAIAKAKPKAKPRKSRKPDPDAVYTGYVNGKHVKQRDQLEANLGLKSI